MLVQVGKRFVSEQREIDETFVKGMGELLRKSKVFNQCHEDFLRDLIVSCNRKEYAPNRYIMEQNTRGDSMFVLYKGVVEVTASGRYICKLRDGSLVGEGALLSIDSRRTASIRSIARCDVAIILRSTFHTILEKYPWEKRKFQREMKNKLMDLGKLVDIKEDVNLEQQAVQCDALKKVPFFADNEDMHDFVAELAMSATSSWYRPGHVIIQEGETRCDEMFVLLKGSVELTSCGEFLGRLENDIFGEICVLDLLERRTANVVAATQCHCMVFTRHIVIPVLAKHPTARMRLLEHAKRRLICLSDAVGCTAKGATPLRLEGCALGFQGVLSPEDSRLFAASTLFRSADVRLLQEISERLTTRTLEEGKTILFEGDAYRAERDSVYWVAKGEVEIYSGGRIMAVVGEGACLGELAFLGAKARRATAKARTPVTLRGITGAQLLEAMRRHEDPELLARWREEATAREEHLALKARQAEERPRTTHIDFMFMKLPGLDSDGMGVPMRTPMGPALMDMQLPGAGARPERRDALPPLVHA